MVSFFLPVVGRHNIIRHRIFNRYLPVLRYQENNLHHIGVGADDLHDTADAVSGDFRSGVGLRLFRRCLGID